MKRSKRKLTNHKKNSNISNMNMQANNYDSNNAINFVALQPTTIHLDLGLRALPWVSLEALVSRPRPICGARASPHAGRKSHYRVDRARSRSGLSD